MVCDIQLGQPVVRATEGSQVEVPGHIQLTQGIAGAVKRPQNGTIADIQALKLVIHAVQHRQLPQIAHVQGSQLIPVHKQLYNTAVLGEIQGGQSIGAAKQQGEIGAAGYVQGSQLITLAGQIVKPGATGYVQGGQLITLTFKEAQAGCAVHNQLCQIVVVARYALKGGAIGQIQLAAQIRIIENDSGGANFPVDILPCNGVPPGHFLVVDAPGGHLVRVVVLIQLETVLYTRAIGLLQEGPELQIVVDVVALGHLDVVVTAAAFSELGVIVHGVDGVNPGNVNGGILGNQGVVPSIPALEHVALRRGGHYGVCSVAVLILLHDVADIAPFIGVEAPDVVSAALAENQPFQLVAQAGEVFQLAAVSHIQHGEQVVGAVQILGKLHHAGIQIRQLVAGAVHADRIGHGVDAQGGQPVVLAIEF